MKVIIDVDANGYYINKTKVSSEHLYNLFLNDRNSVCFEIMTFEKRLDFCFEIALIKIKLNINEH